MHKLYVDISLSSHKVTSLKNYYCDSFLFSFYFLRGKKDLLR